MMLAREMHCEPGFTTSTRKRGAQTEFACWIKHATTQAIRAMVPLGEVDRLPKLSPAAYASLIAANRSRYCRSLDGTALPSSLSVRAIGQSGFALGDQVSAVRAPAKSTLLCARELEWLLP